MQSISFDHLYIWAGSWFGGIKKQIESNTKEQTPGVGDVPVIGNLFKGKGEKDTLNELLIFIAPRVL